ncbi:M14 family zinc carboxypeptidase [uncultured Draconibacterium sp.]|uniref:M14 family zinc carboxypeptidase n=1 Tax=uncultured Draconibacterium sp. TaxID=1573823 RepID=UPI0025E53C79|nr:M14 family zinc carboxypeptidase [uncultured Draconibacterium sp.]
MTKKTALLIAFFAMPFLLFAQKPLLHLKYEQNYTPTYYEIIEMFKLLDSEYDNAKLIENGLTDVGKPLHTFIINSEAEFSPEKIKARGKTVLLINNGIHAGEPCGIDASLEFADNILRNHNNMADLLENTVIVIIPAYSIGGLLQRSAYNRSGQTTPYETGFRGNAGNLDLNRDFVKCDSENAKSFNRIFSQWDPDVFLDTHTTNGSEHQYSVTLIAPSPDMFPPSQEKFIRNKLLPGLYENMKKGDYELIPYVSWMYPDPKMGIKMTQESARYSSGYAALFNSYGMMTENHVYKNYADRVKSCYQFIEVLARFTSAHSKEIIESRKTGIAESVEAKTHNINFELDTTKFETIEFKGYEVDREQISPVTGLPRFGYDKSKPYTANIKYFTQYKATEEIKVPEFYILPQAWSGVIQLLELNEIEFSRLPTDTTLEVEVYYIEEYSDAEHLNNGHYFHHKVTTRSETQEINYYAGDLVIPVRQKKIKYLLELLEPKARDSFFRWNFFDQILDTREYFSSYGFEENAMKYLREHPELEEKLENKRASDPEFAQNHRAQLGFIYNNSEWAEETHKRYPVARIYE